MLEFTKTEHGWENKKGNDRTWQLYEKTDGYQLISHAEKQTYHYDIEGKIQKITDRNGNSTKFHYENGYLKKLKLAGGQYLTFEYKNNLLDTLNFHDVKEETIQNRFGFTGEQFDPVAGLYYLRARFYNPVIGRFIQEDTYYGDGLNLYTYCANNPVRYIDPSGNVCKKVYEQFKSLKKYGLNATSAHEFIKYGLKETNFKKLMDLGLDADEAFDFMKRAKLEVDSAKKGILGEEVMDAIMKKNGYESLPTKLKSNNGIDGIYVKRGANGEITEVVIGEAKFGTSRLNKNTSMGPQMSDGWISGNVNNMMQPGVPKAVQNAAMSIIDFIDDGDYKAAIFRFRQSGYIGIKKA